MRLRTHPKWKTRRSPEGYPVFWSRCSGSPRLKTARESQLVCDLEKLNAETAQTLERIEALLARAKGALGRDPNRARQLLAQAHSLAQTAVSSGLGLSFED
jgi:hypothetical protein